jgi:hypothetical protein
MDEATSSLDTSAESIEKVIDDFKLKEKPSSLLHRLRVPSLMQILFRVMENGG